MAVRVGLFGCLVLFTLLIISDVEASSKLRRRGKYGRLGVPPCTTVDLPPDKWFTQVLDHFDPSNNMTWKQRYQVVTNHHKTGGPVFLNIGGEGTASPLWMVNGSWIDYAKQYNALLFQIEHRYYGKSHPTSDTSVENLRFLTSEQALADIATFVDGMNTLYNLPSDTKWIAFGGSYSGNLAAWVRYKYPHLIHGAMSASGPVLAKLDFYEYFDVVRDSLATYGTNCSKAVMKANTKLRKLINTSSGRKTIEKEFKLCSSIDTSIRNDVFNLYDTLAGNFADIVQYNKDNRFSSPQYITIDTICDIMTNTSTKDYLQRYAAVNSLLMDYYEEDCLDFKFFDMIEQLSNSSWNGPGASSGARQWTYQTCTEFGYYQTSENAGEFFNIDFPLNFFLEQCADIFEDRFATLISKGVNQTNIMYGGLDLQATRVVYVHGSIDPWHALGVTSTRLPESPAIFINGTAHCANMYPASPSDLPALTAARRTVGTLIGQWLQEED